MDHRFTLRVGDELYAWLKDVSRRKGVPMARIIVAHLKAVKANQDRRFLRHIGALKGLPADLSSRKGFSRS